MNRTSFQLVIVDDEASVRKMLQIAFSRLGHRIETFGNAESALAFLEEHPADVIITDLRMHGISGMEFLKKVKQKWTGIEVIMITAHGTIENAIDAVRAGAFDFVQKPFEIAELELTVARAIDQRALRRENEELRRQLQSAGPDSVQFVTASPAMKTVMDLVLKAAPARAGVLLTGDSGTGKERVARALHQLSGRKGGPFLAVNCGAIPETLLEGELFGHVKGAFTGADSTHDGLFQAAGGGTLLLDEIGDMPLPLQVKLLRVLQERSVKPVGGTREIPVDVRVVAATNRNLEEDVRAGRFREDLYYRLNVVSIRMPSLSERREDIPILADQLLSRLASEAAIIRPRLSDEAHLFFMSYAFPGNVRELENMLERAVVLDQDGVIDLADLRPPAASGAQPAVHPEGNLDEQISGLERVRILEALSATGGNRTEAARRLGITFRSLRYRMAKLGLGEG
ncbi:sigma-54 dependent transcriptional regulator [Myxococcota bacterium]|nr:sigma-54 dependent transcriptional regulator [Myxococcota bacterium]MBU1411496.1 sigma-54 dependent transcriptional regulator [Myxococcota bacterium]MBU1512346.1 sigma-54 dependent transcriptional regulator [Myxococcota bacterium]